MSRLIPRGAVVAGLGRRFAAAVLDALPVVVVYLVVAIVLRSARAEMASLATIIVAGVLLAGYGLYQWWAYATRGAGIGAAAMNLRVVGLQDGEPAGWWRILLRQIVFTALWATVAGGIAMLYFLVVHERRRGWHDLVADVVVVEPKPAEPAASKQRAEARAAQSQPNATFSPQPDRYGSHPGSYDAYFPSPKPPEWLPGVHTEPVVPQARWQAPGPQQSPSFPPPPPPPSVQALPANKSWIPLPTPSSVIQPAVKVRQREFGEVEDADGTRIARLPNQAGRSGDEGWYVRLDDGREVELSVTVLLGRNPQRTPEDPAEVHLVPASGDGRMISRTHVLIGTDLRGVFIVDRGSTNGTALVTEGGSLEPAPEHTQVRVRDGQQVSYGNRWFTVLRRPELTRP